MKKILLTLCLITLLTTPAIAKLEGDGSIAYVCAITLFTPRLLIINVVCNGDPVANQEVTITRLYMQGDEKIFSRIILTDEKGLAWTLTEWGKFLVEVNGKEEIVRLGKLFDVKNITIETCE